MSVTASNWLLLVGEALGVGIQKQTAEPFIAWAFFGCILASYSVENCMKKKSDGREVDPKNRPARQDNVSRVRKKERRRRAESPAAMNPNNEAPNLSDKNDRNHLSDKNADANSDKTKEMTADEASSTPTQPNVFKPSKAPSAQEQLAKSTKPTDKPKKDEFDDWDIKLPEENGSEKQDSLMEIVNEINPLAKINPKKKSAKHDMPADPATISGKEKEKSKSIHSGRLTGHPPPQQQVPKMGNAKTATNMMKPFSEDAKQANFSMPLSSCDKKKTNKKLD